MCYASFIISQWPPLSGPTRRITPASLSLRIWFCIFRCAIASVFAISLVVTEGLFIIILTTRDCVSESLSMMFSTMSFLLSTMFSTMPSWEGSDSILILFAEMQYRQQFATGILYVRLRNASILTSTNNSCSLQKCACHSVSELIHLKTPAPRRAATCRRR